MIPTVKEALRLSMGCYEPYKIIFGCATLSKNKEGGFKCQLKHHSSIMKD
jgi:hypothetical protein